MNTKIFVIKRTEKKVPFDKTKIALAIKKGFDNTDTDEIEANVNIVTNKVIEAIEGSEKSILTVDEISLIIEDILKEEYPEVYSRYHDYRIHRNASRELFKDDVRFHKFLKSIEGLASDDMTIDAKRENANVNGNTTMGSMLHLGSALSKEFCKAYKMSPKYRELHDEGYIHIHDLDFMLMGTTTCMQINLEKLFKDGFDTGHGFLREPNDIMTYGALAAIAIQSNQNDQHGGGGKLWPPYMVTYSKKLCEPYQGCQSYA